MMHFVVAALHCATVCSLELQGTTSVLQGSSTSSRLQRRQVLQGLGRLW